MVVGDGPQLAALKGRFPDVHFMGARHGEALSRAYAGGDVMVFPSLTDTFGLVMLESLACGTPVAAFPVTGPKDVLAAGGPGVGAVDPDLRTACLAALAHGDRAACRAYAHDVFVAGLRGPVLRQPGADPAWHGAGELRGGVGWVNFTSGWVLRIRSRGERLCRPALALAALAVLDGLHGTRTPIAIPGLPMRRSWTGAGCRIMRRSSATSAGSILWSRIMFCRCGTE